MQDLEYLISKAVDITKADYAVITGVQIHNCEPPACALPWRRQMGEGGAGAQV